MVPGSCWNKIHTWDHIYGWLWCCCCMQLWQESAMHSRLVSRTSLWSAPVSPPSDSFSPDQPTFSWTQLRLTLQPCHTTAQVARGAASRGRCGVQVSKGSWLWQQIVSSPVSHPAPVSVGKAVAGGQPEAAWVCPWDLVSHSQGPAGFFWGVAEFGQHTLFVNDLFSHYAND